MPGASQGGLEVELIVVGGGLTGLTLGIACAGAGLEVAVIDRESPASMLAEPFDGRTTAIAHGSKQVLEAIGLWRRVAEVAEPIREIRVADGGSPLFLHYDHRDLGDAPLGYIVENRLLRQALMAEAASLPTLRHLAPQAVERVEREEARAVARLADGGSVTGALVAACDGGRSPLRRAAGIKTISWDYPQVSIVCTVRHALPHQGVAVEHFLPAGPFAILPMTGNRSSIVWTESAALAPALLALDEARFMAELGGRFGDFLARCRSKGRAGRIRSRSSMPSATPRRASRWWATPRM